MSSYKSWTNYSFLLMPGSSERLTFEVFNNAANGQWSVVRIILLMWKQGVAVYSGKSDTGSENFLLKILSVCFPLDRRSEFSLIILASRDIQRIFPRLLHWMKECYCTQYRNYVNAVDFVWT